MDLMPTELKISEIFYSIQGESTFAGLPCIFIRLSDCNLRCNYCDAAYTWKEKGGLLSIEDIIAKVNSFPCNLIEVTGGEPLFQDECLQLLRDLVTAEKTVLLETNGSFKIDSVPAAVTCILDVKCPDSSSGNSFDLSNIHEIQNRVVAKPGSCEVKFVLSSKKDYLWARDFIHKHDIANVLPILFSPVQDRIKPQDIAEWLMAEGLNVRLQLQLHTILWPEITRGV